MGKRSSISFLDGIVCDFQFPKVLKLNDLRTHTQNTKCVFCPFQIKSNFIVITNLCMYICMCILICQGKGVNKTDKKVNKTYIICLIFDLKRNSK